MAQPEVPKREAARGAGDHATEPERGDRASGEHARTGRPRGLLARWLPLAAPVTSGLASPKRRVAVARALAAPLVVALIPLFWVLDATHRATLMTLGRDQGIFQYVGWAIARGEVDYRDIRDVNGPLIHLIHQVMLALGGADEHRFHVLDLTLTGLSFAVLGACVPGLVARRRPSWLERGAWAAAAWVVLMGQYQLFTYWNQAQRESFCDWFLLPSLGLQLATPARTPKGAKARVVAVAALSTITWFGKPTFAIFSLMQLAVLLAPSRGLLSRKRRAAWSVAGGALGAAIPLAYLLFYGDLLAYLRISLVDVPNVYRFIWAKSAPEILGQEGPLLSVTAGLAASAILVSLVWLRELPTRVLALALAPVCGIASVIVQHKGFGYHFHPLTATTHAGFMVVVVMLWEKFRGAPRARPIGRYLALAAAAALALEDASSMKTSPQERNVWILAGGETPARRQSQPYFESFETHDFFPWEMREAARYLAASTPEDARVQIYGMDPYLLFLARRRSATPYIYAYDLNDDAALEGGWSNRPTPAYAARIEQIRDAHERDLLARLEASPPAAFVFMDRAPLISHADAWEDFGYCCAATARWVSSRYRPARSFGAMRVWLRDDLPVTGDPPTP